MSYHNGNGVSLSNPMVLSPSRSSPMMREIVPILDRDRLTAWMLDWSHPNRKKFQCSWFVLNKRDSSGGEVATQDGFHNAKELAGLSEEERLAWIEKMVESFDHTSTVWAQEQAVPTHFLVGCFTTSVKDEGCLSQFPFHVAPSQNAIDALTNEFGTSLDEKKDVAPQLVGHLQRLLDTTVRLVAQNGQSDKDRLVEQVDKREAMIDKLLAERAQLFDQQQTLMDQQARRQIEIEKERTYLDLQQKMIMQGFQVLLPVAKQFLVNKGLRAAEQEEHPMIAFARTLSPSQLVRFIADLSDEQKQLFGPMAQQLVNEMPEDKKKELAEVMVASQAAREAKKMGETQ